ncbi:MAG: glycosyl transferase family 1 [Sulfurimonas sp.]|nr:MAG: glycosyl transferase family 1 [Sulfurimonas sp.]
MNLLVMASTKGSYNSLRPEAEIYISLAQNGYNITIMTQENGAYTSRFLEYNIKLIDTDYKKKIDLKIIKNAKKIIGEENIDIVYATDSKSLSNAMVSCIGTKVKLVAYRGTTGGLYRHDPSSYLNALNPRVDAVVCVSKSVQKHVSKQVFTSKKNVVAIYKGHKTEWYNQGKVNLEEFSTHKNNFNIAFVANVRPHKGLIYVLQAAKQLAYIRDIHILLIGEKISQEPYLSAIKNSGMSERIHTTGYRNDVPAIISACDILLHASTRKEGLPRVILESLACDTPVIASSNESSLEIIEDGINGYITPIKDSTAIAKKIEYLYNEPDILKRLSSNCKYTIDNKMSHEITIKKYINFFNSIF